MHFIKISCGISYRLYLSAPKIDILCLRFLAVDLHPPPSPAHIPTLASLLASLLAASSPYSFLRPLAKFIYSEPCSCSALFGNTAAASLQ